MENFQNVSGQLVVTLIRNISTNIFLVDIQSGDSINLTNNSSNNRYGEISPDGRMLAFTSDRDGEHNIFLMDLITRETKQLTFSKKNEICYMPCWTRDCKTIVFGMHGEKSLMASISPEGGKINIIGEGHDPSVSADGKKIAYTGENSSGYFVSTCNFDGTENKQITSNLNTIGGVFPSWSPDGTELLYSDFVNGYLEIFKCNADGSNAVQLTKLKQACTPAAWSPDSKFITFRCTQKPFWIDAEAARIVYDKRIADTRPVWIMDVDGNHPQIIEPLHYQCAMDGSRPNWSPIKKKIYLM